MKMPSKGLEIKLNMKNYNNKMVLALLALAALLQLNGGNGVAAHLNVFLNPEEVMRLLGKFSSAQLTVESRPLLLISLPQL